MLGNIALYCHERGISSQALLVIVWCARDMEKARSVLDHKLCDYLPHSTMVCIITYFLPFFLASSTISLICQYCWFWCFPYSQILFVFQNHFCFRPKDDFGQNFSISTSSLKTGHCLHASLVYIDHNLYKYLLRYSMEVDSFIQ